jgi:hypothetical protein
LAAKTNKPLILCAGNITRSAIKDEYFDRNISLLSHPICASVLLEEIDKRLVSEHGGLYEGKVASELANKRRQEERIRQERYEASQACTYRHINSDVLWAELFEPYD